MNSNDKEELPAFVETDEHKPTITVAYLTIPIVSANFATDAEGGNGIAEQVMKMAEVVYNETTSKLVAGAMAYCNALGIQLIQMDKAVVNNMLKDMVNSGEFLDNDGTFQKKGLVDKDGNINHDPDREQAVITGRSTDN